MSIIIIIFYNSQHRRLFVLFEQVADSSELVGDLEAIDCLSKEYSADDNVYQAKIKVGVACCYNLTLFNFCRI